MVAAALLAEQVVGRNPLLTSGDGAPILRSLTAWDGWWYLGVARNGYHVQPIVGSYHDYAFLPGWPALVRVLSWPWPDYAGLVSVVSANVLFLVGIALLVRLGRVVLGDERAIWGAALLALLPFSAVYSMAYGESLFLCLSVGALLAAERDRRMLAGVLVALAALARLQGAVLAVPVGLILFLRDGRRLRWSQAWVLLGPLAAIAFVGGVGLFAGGSNAYGAAQAAWGRSGVGAAGRGPGAGGSLSLVNVAQLVTLRGRLVRPRLRPGRPDPAALRRRGGPAARPRLRQRDARVRGPPRDELVPVCLDPRGTTREVVPGRVADRLRRAAPRAEHGNVRRALRPVTNAPRVGLPVILAVFVLSGAAGLIYEIVWSRQLVLVFGNTTQAVSTILTGFFGGMAIGSGVGGRSPTG